MKKLLLSILNGMFMHTLYSSYTFCENLQRITGFKTQLKVLQDNEKNISRIQVNDWAVVIIYTNNAHYITKIDIESIK